MESNIPRMVSNNVLDTLTDLASKALGYTAIIEVGAWLGASTAAVCKGADSKHIHVYDRFRPSSTEIEKAMNYGIDLRGIADTSMIMIQYVEPYLGNNTVTLHKTEIESIKYKEKQPISFYIDDASKQPKLWKVVTSEFFPYLIPGAYVALLDYMFFETTESELHRCQYDWMKDHPEFEMTDLLTDEPHARVFVYHGN